jgi:hypothetical protein
MQELIRVLTLVFAPFILPLPGQRYNADGYILPPQQNGLPPHLVGEGINAHFDKKTLQRIQDIEKLDEDTKEKVYFLIDNIIQNTKAKKAFNS